MDNKVIGPEELEVKKEQIYMLFENRKAKDDLEEYVIELLVEYIEYIVAPYSLSDDGVKCVRNLIDAFTLEEIFSAIDKGKKQYLEYDRDGVLNKESALKFVNKIGGIIVNTRKGPIVSKQIYLMGICKNRFEYWNEKRGESLLDEYIVALRNQDYSDEEILKDLGTDMMRLCKIAQNWTEWRTQITEWIDEINSWSEQNQNEDEINTEEIVSLAQSLASEVVVFFDFIWYLSQVYRSYERGALFENYINCIDTYLKDQVSVLMCKRDTNGDEKVIEDLRPDCIDIRDLVGFIRDETIDTGLKFSIDEMLSDYIPIWLGKLYLPSNGIHSKKGAILFKSLYDKMLIEKTCSN